MRYFQNKFFSALLWESQNRVLVFILGSLNKEAAGPGRLRNVREGCGPWPPGAETSIGFSVVNLLKSSMRFPCPVLEKGRKIKLI